MIPLIEVVRIAQGYEGWTVRATFGDGAATVSARLTPPQSEMSAWGSMTFLYGAPRVAWSVLAAHVGGLENRLPV